MPTLLHIISWIWWIKSSTFASVLLLLGQVAAVNWRMSALMDCGHGRVAHGVRRTGAKDQTFQQGIAGQPVCPVDAGAGRLTRRVKSGNIGLTFQVRSYPPIM